MDKERGFHGYFWKAVPWPVKKHEAREREISFDGQVAVVTGAGGGLGRIYALDLASRGARVVVNDLGGGRDGSGGSPAAADRVVQEIRDFGGEAVANYDSVATSEGGQKIVDTAIENYGRLDILINNAGILRDKTLLKMEPETWQAVIDVHLSGAYNLTRPAFLKMREQGYGRIIVTTSAAGLYGNFGQTNYAAAKMGLIGFMNTLKAEGDKYNIKINAVAPVAATRLTEDIFPPDLLARSRPEFVSPLVLYLCSEDNQDSGLIFNAGMGYFNRAAVVTGAGTIVGDGATPPDLEDIHRNFAAIDSLEETEEFPNAMAALTPILEAFQPQRKKEPRADGPPAVQDIFDRMPAAFQSDQAAGVDVVFLFDITGPGGGQWSLTIREGDCRIRKERPEKPTTTLTISDQDFIAMMTGQLSPMSAFTSGRLKIGGDVMKSQLMEKLFKF